MIKYSLGENMRDSILEIYDSLNVNGTIITKGDIITFKYNGNEYSSKVILISHEGNYASFNGKEYSNWKEYDCLTMNSICDNRTKFRVDNIEILNVKKDPVSLLTKASSFQTEIVLYHGTNNKDFKLDKNYKNEYTDYGPGFYLTPYIELAKEWSSINNKSGVGYVHEYRLNLSNLFVFYFDAVNPLVWLSELAYHYNDIVDDKGNRMNLIHSFRLYDTDRYDIVSGWRADGSFRNIMISILNDELSVEYLDEALRLGDLKAQYCIKQERVYKELREVKVHECDADVYINKYNNRLKYADDKLNIMIKDSINKKKLSEVL